MTEQDFDTMEFHNNMKFKYKDTLTGEIQILEILGVDFKKKKIIMNDKMEYHYWEVTLINEVKDDKSH